MKHISIAVPDSKFKFFIELIRSLGFVKIEEEQELYIPEAHKQLVRDRIKNSKPEDFKNWDEIKNSFKLE